MIVCVCSVTVWWNCSINFSWGRCSPLPISHTRQTHRDSPIWNTPKLEIVVYTLSYNLYALIITFTMDQSAEEEEDRFLQRWIRKDTDFILWFRLIYPQINISLEIFLSELRRFRNNFSFWTRNYRGLVIRPYFWLFITPIFFGGSKVAVYKNLLFLKAKICKRSFSRFGCL